MAGRPRKDMTGYERGWLHVTGPAGTRGGEALWECRCSACGRTGVVVRGSYLRNTRGIPNPSCGCQQGLRNTALVPPVPERTPEQAAARAVALVPPGPDDLCEYVAPSHGTRPSVRALPSCGRPTVAAGAKFCAQHVTAGNDYLSKTAPLRLAQEVTVRCALCGWSELTTAQEQADRFADHRARCAGRAAEEHHRAAA